MGDLLDDLDWSGPWVVRNVGRIEGPLNFKKEHPHAEDTGWTGLQYKYLLWFRPGNLNVLGGFSVKACHEHHMRKTECRKKYEYLSPRKRRIIGVESEQDHCTERKGQSVYPKLKVRFEAHLFYFFPSMQAVLEDKENSEGRYQGKGTQNQERKRNPSHTVWGVFLY